MLFHQNCWCNISDTFLDLMTKIIKGHRIYFFYLGTFFYFHPVCFILQCGNLQKWLYQAAFTVLVSVKGQFQLIKLHVYLLWLLVGDAFWLEEVLLPRWSMARRVVRNWVPMAVNRIRLADAFITRKRWFSDIIATTQGGEWKVSFAWQNKMIRNVKLLLF